MNKIIVFLLISVFLVDISAQDTLTPLETNADKVFSKYKKYELKSQIFSNKIFIWDQIGLPFTDEFSSDRTLPRDLSPYLSGSYYRIGLCADRDKLVKSLVDFSTTQTYLYFYDVSKAPEYYDSIPLAQIDIFLANNIPLCNFPSVINLYPSTFKKRFFANGKIKDSFLIKDTTISLAFIEEYIIKDILWTDNFAYINDHFAYLPIGKGVATLDGLNEKGRPYQPNISNAEGLADHLTSIPIDLSGITPQDSLYLSFFYQPQGYGDYPDKQDSLLVEFKRDNSTEWVRVFIDSGYRIEKPLDSIMNKQILIYVKPQSAISDPQFYHDSFQFRFKNYATISGNNDHWHIDYVKLDTARNKKDTFINDANFIYELPTILKYYTQLPAKHFNPLTDLKDTLIAYNRNANPTLSTYTYSCKNINTGVIYKTVPPVPYSTLPLVKINLFPKTQFNIPLTILDSTYIETKIHIPNGDNYRNNDTATGIQHFFNELAYDDGTAEWAYGIQGTGIKKVAVKYFIPNLDTIAAIKILFSNIDVNVENLIFNLNIWKNIGLNGKTEKILKTITNLKPIYDTVDRNGFYVFGLDTPLAISDTFYIGWTQSDDRNLQIGYDHHSTLGHDKMYKLTDNVWSKTSVAAAGSPMIRPILDGKRDYRPKNTASIEQLNIEKSKFLIYPNPAKDYLHISNPNYDKISISIYDLIGRKLKETEVDSDTKIDIQELKNGIYFLQIKLENELIQTEKISIEH